MLRLIQISFSHNCVKVRRVLELKGLRFETLDISPMDRAPVRQASGQGSVPVLVDGERAIVDSTAILRHLEDAYPESPLLPRDPRLRAECLVLEDWADAAFMALTRRMLYWKVIATPGGLEGLFCPEERGLSRWISGFRGRRAVRRRFGLSAERNRKDEAEARRVAALAIERLAGRPYLVGDSLTLADVTLAAMSSPLRLADPAIRDDPHVQALLAWGRGILGDPWGSWGILNPSPS